MKIQKATHTGVLKIGEIELQCAVLEDGTRVISERGVTKGLGGKRGGSHWRRMREEDGANLPVYLSAKNLREFINKDLETELMAPILYTSKGKQANGLPAKLLPKICDVLLQAKDADKLHPSQAHIAKNAEILIRGLAQVGIIALVDEATGYQEVRDRLALQEILEKYISKELIAWTKQFPDEFYKELFRLRGWGYNPFSVQRPAFVGKLTKDLVYARLAPGIVEELQRLNPKTPKGYRKDKHHQWLTEDIGHTKLREHLATVTAFMRACANWNEFYRLVQRALPKFNETIHLFFPEDEKPGEEPN